jgi:putative spermidine/putrescine transport system permease protein
MSRPVPLVSAVIAVLGAAFFIVPLIATFNFSLRMKRGELLFEAYRSVFESDVFVSVLSFSAVASLLAILVGIVIVVPTAYWVRLRVPRMRPVVEFLSLMPLIIPPVV